MQKRKPNSPSYAVVDESMLSQGERSKSDEVFGQQCLVYPPDLEVDVVALVHVQQRPRKPRSMAMHKGIAHLFQLVQKFMFKSSTVATPLPSNLDIIRSEHDTFTAIHSSPNASEQVVQTFHLSDPSSSTSQPISYSDKQSPYLACFVPVQKEIVIVMLNSSGNLRIFDATGQLRLCAKDLLDFCTDVKPKQGETLTGQAVTHHAYSDCTHMYIGTNTGHLLSIRLAWERRRLLVETAVCFKAISAGSLEICQTSINAEGSLLATLHPLGALRIWKVTRDSIEKLFERKGDGIPLVVLKFLKSSILVVGSSTGVIAIYSIDDTLVLLAEVDAHAGWITGMDVVETGSTTLIATISEDQMFMLWTLTKEADGAMTIALQFSHFFKSFIPYGLKLIPEAALLTGLGQQGILKLSINAT